jgi:hypothetical protein
MMGKRRAVGEIVAAMVLLLIVSVGGGLLFSISMKEGNQQSLVLRDEMSAESGQIQERFKIIYVGSYEDKLCVWILNYGNVDIKISHIYLYEYGELQDQSYEPCDPNKGTGDFEALLVRAQGYIEDTDYERNFVVYRDDIKKFYFRDIFFEDVIDVLVRITVTTERGVSVFETRG